MRSDERYFADIRHAIRDFYRPGDRLRLVRQYTDSRKCEMCGGIVDITNCYDLQNLRTGKLIVCGERCIARYAEVITLMGQAPSIVFPHEYRDKAEKVNQHRRDTVTVEDESGPESSEDSWSFDDLIGSGPGADDPAYEDALADGLDPEEIDWESHDYE
jgi:hypothetical protein